MSVRKRGRFYHYQFVVDGRTYCGVFNGKNGQTIPEDKQEAKIQEAEIVKAVRNGTYKHQSGLNVFSVFVDKVFLDYSKEHKKSYSHDVFRCEMLKEFFGDKTFREITPMLVEKFIKERLNSKTLRVESRDEETVINKQRSPVTVHKEVSLLSSIFNMAITERVAEYNPCQSIRKNVRKQLKARNKRDRYLNQYAPDEEERLFEALTGPREHLRPIVRITLDTGLRSSELRALKREHVNLSESSKLFEIRGEKILLMPGELLVEESKNGKPRTIPLTNKARKILEIILEDETLTGEYVFTSKKTGGQLSQIKKGFAKAVDLAGLHDFHFHDLRHTFSVRLNEAGVDPFTIRDLMGHSTVNMTSDYTHSTPSTRRNAVANLEEISNESGKIVAIDNFRKSAK